MRCIKLITLLSYFCCHRQTNLIVWATFNLLKRRQMERAQRQNANVIHLMQPWVTWLFFNLPPVNGVKNDALKDLLCLHLDVTIRFVLIKSSEKNWNHVGFLLFPTSQMVSPRLFLFHEGKPNYVSWATKDFFFIINILLIMAFFFFFYILLIMHFFFYILSLIYFYFFLHFTNNAFFYILLIIHFFLHSINNAFFFLHFINNAFFTFQ